MITRDITIDELASLKSYSNKDIVIVGDTSLVMNHLIYDMKPITILTDYEGLDKTPGVNMLYEYYHFHDKKYNVQIHGNIWKPTAEKAILDTIVWLPENMNEGSLIEALQTYQNNGNDKTKLYECADHYGVPHEFVDYWWREAEEETDMSMG